MGNRWVVLIKANSSTWTKFPQTINLQIFGLFSRYKMCGGGRKWTYANLNQLSLLILLMQCQCDVRVCEIVLIRE